ncbi:MAG TPA: biotin/lipoyl-containing protein [Thermoanaerobaculia bacterium]|nr:biotin/lipoyl-containing protein [Thermoanaerobaculia bacterium]
MELIVRSGEREEPVRVERSEAGYRVTLAGRTFEVDLAAVAEELYSLRVDGAQQEVSVHRLEEGRYRVAWAGGSTEVEVADPLTVLARSAHGAAAVKGPRRVAANMPGRVVAILAAEGTEVAPGQGVVVLEAMKMENEIQADRAGTIRAVFVTPGQAVEGGDPLFEIG